MIFTLLLLLISSCRKKDATVKLPKVPEQLVIISFISPQDSLIKVSLGLTQPLYNNANSNKFSPVTDAEVIISSALGSASLIYNPGTKNYLTDSAHLKIRTGVKYTITVSTPDGKSASATTQIPSENTSLKFEIDPDASNLKATWLDPASEINYYRLLVERSGYFIFSGYNNSTGSFKDTIRTRYVDTEWIMDEGHNGETIVHQRPFGLDSTSGESVNLMLFNVSKEYFDYAQKLPTATVNENPFAEPVIMYTNVTGGYGVFAGYNGYKIVVFP